MDTQQYQGLTQLLQQVLDERSQVKTIVAQEIAIRLRDLLIENEHLRQQVELKNTLLAAQGQLLELLRAGHNRPN